MLVSSCGCLCEFMGLSIHLRLSVYCWEHCIMPVMCNDGISISVSSFLFSNGDFLLFDELVLFVSPLNKLLSFSLLYYLIFPSYFVYTYDRFVHLHKFIMFNRNLRVIFHVFFAALKVKINCRDYIFSRFFLHSEFLLLHKVCLSRKMKRFGNVKLLKRLSIVL